jgi:hypothetical protein
MIIYSNGKAKGLPFVFSEIRIFLPFHGEHMTPDRKFKMLYAAACDYLESKIGKIALEQKLDHYRHYKVDSMFDVFWHLVNSPTNKVGMRATIGDIDPLEPFLFDFDPWQTQSHYQDNWKLLFKTVEANHQPPGPMNITNGSSYWVLFCKGILSGAEFLSLFDSFESFDEFVNSFAFNDTSIAALPILLDQEIYGMGFPLGCDWLKEMGYGDYGKPDVHTGDILFETGVAQSRDNYEVLKTMVRVGRINDELPAVVDRLLWFIGSGKYVDENVKITRQKMGFIKDLRAKLDAK